MYSHLIHLLRYALPLIFVCFLGLLIGWPWLEGHFNDDGVFTPIQAQQTDTAPTPPQTNTAASTLENPRFSGVDAVGRPYVITANSASTPTLEQDISSSTSEIILDHPLADIFLNEQTWLALRSHHGRYVQTTQTLTLSGNIEAYHDNGYSFYTEGLAVDLRQGFLTTSTPATLQGPIGKIDGNTMIAFLHEKKIRFSGPSRLVLWPSSQAE